MMRAAALPRLVLTGAGIAVALAATLPGAGICLLPVAITYIVLGEIRLLRRYLPILGTVVGASAILWLFIDWDFSASGLPSAIFGVLSEGSHFASLFRMAVASSIVVLALGAAQDGQHLGVARAMGLPSSAAATYASAIALIPLVRESVERSLVCLRAHGVVDGSSLSIIRNLPALLALTWNSCLDLALERAQVKWVGNGFLHSRSMAFVVPLQTSRRHNLVCLIAALACVAITVGVRSWP